MIILKVPKKKRNMTYDILNADIFLIKEGVNERVNCTHVEERSDQFYET